MVISPHRPIVFFDADVIFAGAASPNEQSASNVILRLGELTLIRGITSEQAVTEVDRNLNNKLPSKLPEFRLIISRCLHVVPDPELATLSSYKGQADPNDLPLLVAALREDAAYFLTFNTRHYYPSTASISIQQPGTFLLTIRSLLTQMR